MTRPVETYGQAYDAADRAAAAQASWEGVILDVALTSTVIFLALMAIYGTVRWISTGPVAGEHDDDQPVCEDCSLVLTDDTRATTCAAHRLCVDCDAHRVDHCRDCRAAKSDAAVWCIPFDDPFFDRFLEAQARRQDPPAVRAWLTDGGAR